MSTGIVAEDEEVNALGWALSSGLLIIYIAMIFTVGVMTYRKGHTTLLILGVIIPVFWLIGAIMPARPGSQYDAQMRQHYRHR